MAAEQPVPGYNVVHIIGQGGQAQVYLAEREHDGLRVALKVLNKALRNDRVFLERFVREYKLVASLNSAYVARIYDQGFSGDFPYIAMEFLPSGTLASRIREGLTTRAALRIAAQIAQALDAIHSRGIVHRDLKPANILFRADGRPVLVDFGPVVGPNVAFFGEHLGCKLHIEDLATEVDKHTRTNTRDGLPASLAAVTMSSADHATSRSRRTATSSWPTVTLPTSR